MGRKTKQNKYWTQEKWDKVSDFNKNLIEEFLQSLQATDKSDKTIDTYRNALQISMIYIMENCQNKDFVNIKKVDILKFQNYLMNIQKLSPARVKFIKSSLSSMSNFLENYYDEVFPDFRNIINKIPHPTKAAVREKTFLTQEQIDILINSLEEKNDWLKLSVVSLALISGARKGEIFQVTKDCVNNKIKENMYKTNTVRGKSRGKIGKRFELAFDEQTAIYMRKYLEERGEDDEPLLFVLKRNDEVKPCSPNNFNKWCENNFSKLLKTPVYPHCFRSSRAEILNSQGVPIGKIKSLLHHESTDTTNIYLKPRDDQDIEDIFDI